MIHGLHDDIVPPEFSRRYVERKKMEDVHLLEIAQADHFDLINPHSAAWTKIEETVVSLLDA